jgi:hypothetical protein
VLWAARRARVAGQLTKLIEEILQFSVGLGGFLISRRHHTDLIKNKL